METPSDEIEALLLSKGELEVLTDDELIERHLTLGDACTGLMTRCAAVEQNLQDAHVEIEASVKRRTELEKKLERHREDSESLFGVNTRPVSYTHLTLPTN